MLEEIEEELDNINISEKDFERIKKVWIANEVKITDSIASMQRNIFSDIIIYNKIIDNKVDLNYNNKSQIATIKGRTIEFKLKKNQKVVRMLAVNEMKNYLAKPEKKLRLGLVTYNTK